jgi:hypothetical protein
VTKSTFFIMSFCIATALSFSARASDTMEQYAQKCDQAIGVTVPDFVCDAGTLVPDTHPTGSRCDRPNQLNMVCDPGSRFQVLTDNANAAVVAHCRKKGHAAGEFGDIAVIQYSKKNGATCFYQALGTLSGNVKAPSKGTGGFWLTPTDTAGIGCAECHDNGPLIRSPYLTQLKDIPNEKNVLPGSHDSSFNSTQPYAFVGSDFSSWKAYKVEVNGNLCNDCHRMGVSNLTALDANSGTGTALDFGIRATAAWDHNKNHSKNPDSADSPLWMTPGQITFSQSHLNSATEIQKCALRRDEHPLPNSDVCRLTLYASAFTEGSPDRYAAIWAKIGPSEWVARHGMTSEQYQQEFDKFVGQGFRLVTVDGYEIDGSDRYAAIWNKVSSPPWEAHHGMTSAAYQAEFDKLVSQGFRLVWVNGYTVQGQDRYAAIWEKSQGPAFIARHGMTSDVYQAEFNKHVADGFRLVVVSGYAIGGEARYAAIWQRDLGPPFVARHGMTSAEYQQAFDKNVADGFRLALVNGYRIGDQTLYAAIWDKKASPAWVARHGMTSGEYQTEFNSLISQGFRLIDVSGY